jgi:transcriptional antiterminator RfaH
MDSKDQIGSIKYSGSFHWYVIHTKPRDEQRVTEHFEGMGIETVLPLCKNYRYPYDRMRPLLNPLFPNYLFARLDLEHHYYKVKWTRGVNRILGIGSEPIPISERVIQMLKERMGDDDTVQLLEDIQEGTIVQITSGPLKDFVGAFQKGLSSSGRVRILLNLIGTDLPVQIYRWQIKKVA